MPIDDTSKWTSLFWFTVIFGSITIGQRFALPFDESQFGIGFLICLVVMLMLTLTSRLTIDPARLILYFIAMAGCLATLFFKRGSFSVISLMMLFTIYFPYILSFRISFNNYLKLLSSFQDIMMFCVWSGLIQFGIQFILSPDYMFPFDMILPESFFIPEFNLRIPITETLPYEKSTGLWFLEPSHFSQFLAFAVIIELRYFNRPKRLLFYLGSMVLCFSGTGVILLTVVGSILVISQGRVGVIFTALLGVASIFLFRDFFPFSVFFDRLSDFTNPLASGSGRFLGPYWVIGTLIDEGRSHILTWGIGPGQIALIVENTDYFVQDSSWFKLLMEYGYVGVFFFLIFFISSLYARSPDKILSSACLVQFLFLGGYLLSFYVHFLYLVLVVWPEIVEDEATDWFGDDRDALVESEADAAPGFTLGEPAYGQPRGGDDPYRRW